MAALPADNTPRAFLTYNVDGANHTLMVRMVTGTSDGDLSEDIGAFLEALGPQLTECTFVKFERSIEGSNVRNPATWSGPMTWGSGAQVPSLQPKFWSFTGKDGTGHKTRVDMYGRHLVENENMRLFASEDTTIADALAALAAAELAFVSISGSTPTWNAYANESTAQHWIKELRK